MSKKRQRTVGHYGDCFPFLDSALANGGIRLPEMPAKEAHVLRHRMYRARGMLLRAAEARCKTGELPSTPYDTIVIRLVPHTAKGEEMARLVMEIQAPRTEVFGQIERLDGLRLEEAEEGEWEKAAREARGTLGLE